MLKRLKSKKLLYILVVVNILLLAVNVILLVKNNSDSKAALDSKNYLFLSKRLEVENPNDIIVNFSPLRTQAREYLNNTGLEHSFYFEYLPSGTSIRIGENTELAAASLMKIPIVMSLYRAEELGRLKLDEKATIAAGDLSSESGELYKKGAGYQITLQEAADLTLIHSDNTAINVIIDRLNQVIDPKDQALYFLDAEITVQDNSEVAVLISSRSYSSFLKCLYLSCYLERKHSQEILSKLTQTPFDDLLVAGVSDKDIVIAHKIGTFSKNVQSDCGIVYYPKRPYLVCLMIRGDETQARPAFKEISKQIYDYILKVDQ